VLDVPVIDLAAFRTGSPADRAAVAARLDEAARTVGFMQVVGHDVPAEVEAGLTAAMDGSLRPADVAEESPAAGVHRDEPRLHPAQAERLSLSLGVDSPADLFEAFNVGNGTDDFPGLELDEVPYAPNLWPMRPRVVRGRGC